jgi:hypothetical protein
MPQAEVNAGRMFYQEGLPQATILLGCWAEDIDKEALEDLRETAKADATAGSLREAMMICRTTAGVQEIEGPDIVTTALGIAS